MKKLTRISRKLGLLWNILILSLTLQSCQFLVADPDADTKMPSAYVESRTITSTIPPQLTTRPVLAPTDTLISFPVGQKNQIIFVSNQNALAGDAHIYRVDSDGENLTQLTVAPGWNGAPAWSPDRQSIAFFSTRDDPNRQNSEIYLMDWDGGHQRRLTHTNIFSELDPVWSPDGQRIAYSAGKNEDYDNRAIYILQIDDSTPIRLTQISHNDLNPTWSPDGQYIAFSRYFSSLRKSDIYVVKTDGSNLTQLTNNDFTDFSPAWSPDGSKIAFVSGRDGNLEIYTMNIDGSNQTRLTNNMVADDHPTWSPDGQYIAFASQDSIYIMDASGVYSTALVSNPIQINTEPSWSP